MRHPGFETCIRCGAEFLHLVRAEIACGITATCDPCIDEVVREWS